MSFVDDLSRHYYEHQFAKNAIVSLLESKTGDKLGRDHSSDNSTENAALQHEHPVGSSPFIALKEIDGEKEKETVTEELLNHIPYIPEVPFN